MVKEIIIVVLLLLGLSWLGLACLYVVAMRRTGSRWSPAARLWAWLRIVGYVGLALIIAVVISGVSSWAIRAIGVVWFGLVVGESLVRRRIRDWPPPADFTTRDQAHAFWVAAAFFVLVGGAFWAAVYFVATNSTASTSAKVAVAAALALLGSLQLYLGGGAAYFVLTGKRPLGSSRLASVSRALLKERSL